MNKQKTLRRIRKAVDKFSDFLWDQTCQYNSHQPQDLWGYNKQILLNVFNDVLKDELKIVNKQVKEKIKELKQERKMYEQRHDS
jgi:hypothetical protein